jgi:peroxiredoxin
MSQKLNAGDQFPSVKLNLTDGSSISIPEDNNSPYTIVLFYRGHW